MSLRLDEWRRARNISQSELAERCGVSTMTIRSWELHPEQIKMKYVPKIEEALSVSRNDIIFLPIESN